MRFSVKLFLCVSTSVLLFLSFPKTDAWFLAWIAYAPLFSVILLEKSAKKAFAEGFFSHVVFYSLLLWWVAFVPHIGSMGIPAVLALSCAESLFAAVFCAAFWNISKKTLSHKSSLLRLFHAALFSSALFVACDYVRSLGFFGFTWGALGYSQYKNLPVIQISEWTGYYGVTFLVMFVNVCLVMLPQFLYVLSNPRGRKILKILSIFCAVSILVVATTNLLFKMTPPLVPFPSGHDVAIIQGNTKRDVHWDGAYREYVWKEYEKLSREAMKHNPRPNLLVYPESLIALGDFSEPYYTARFAAIARKFRVTLATGGFDRDAQGNTYNAAAVFSPDGKILGKFYKTKLVPFGEYALLKDMFVKLGYNPWGDWVNLSAGKNFKPVFARTVGDIGFNICYETTYAHISRQLVKNGANVLIGIVADSWFKEVETYQQTAMFVFRAVENRRYAIRAADSGISAIITPKGEILNATKPFTQAIIHGDIFFPFHSITFYTRYGDVFVAFCVIYCMITSAFLFMQKENNRV